MEHLEDPETVLDRLAATLKPGGVLVMLVPNAPALYGSLDRSLGHRRRYSGADVRQLAERGGFQVAQMETFNKVALLPWWAYSRLLNTRNISKLVLKIFDKSVWFWRRLDPFMPLPGLSLLMVARKPTGSSAQAVAARSREATHDAN
jgi:hypothetical protein